MARYPTNISSTPINIFWFVVKRTGNEIGWSEFRDIWYHDLIKDVSSHCEPEEMDEEDPIISLYTYGSNGKTKGVLHTTGG